jgi:hypothetical protein
MSSIPDAEPSLTAMPFRALLGFSFTNAMTWMIALGTPMVLLAGELGATTFEVGVAYACVFFLLPVQILATATLPRFGYKRQMIFGWSTRAVFLLIPLGLALKAPAEPTPVMVYALVGSVIGFAFFRCLGSCAVMPWIYSHVPEEIRGRYFATDQSLTGVSGVLTLLLCAALFALLPRFEAFVWQYLFAFLGTALSVLLLSRVPDAPKPETTSVGAILAETPQWCLRPGPFREYLLFMLAANLVMTAFPPFIAYYLKVEASLPSDRILVYTALQYVGAIVGSLWMRSRIDRVGVKPAFRIALLVLIGLMGYWISLVVGVSHASSFLPVSYFAFGAAMAHWNAANLKYLPRVCPEEKRALAVSIHSSVVGVLGGAAPIIWGIILKRSDLEAGVEPGRFITYLGLAAVVQFGLFLYIPRLVSGDRSMPPILSNANLLRSMRYFGSLINLVPVPTRSTRKASEETEER